MLNVAIGALLGLGLFILLNGSGRSGLEARIAPHIRDVRASRASSEEPEDSVLRVLRALAGAGAMFRRRSRNSAIADELVGVLDLFSLCVSTGMSIPDTFARIAERGSGFLAAECRLVSAEIALGVSVTDALHASDTRIADPVWSRLIEHLVLARVQGTPLTVILRSLVDDEQAAAGNRLLESASAKETLMMFPLVFVILPVTVVIAIFPGLSALGSLSL